MRRTLEQRKKTMKYRVDWFYDKPNGKTQHNKTHFPTYEDACTYAESMMAVCTGVKSVFILEMTARYGVYDVAEQIK